MNIEAPLIGPYKLIPKDKSTKYFEDSIFKQKGIYFWSIKYKDKFLTYYIGETGRSFYLRTKEHIKDYLSGEYGFNDPNTFKNGERKFVWKGHWRNKDNNSILEYLSNHDSMFPVLMEYLDLFYLHFLPLDIDDNDRINLEHDIAKDIYSQDGIIGNFQEPDIQYMKRKTYNPITFIIPNGSVTFWGFKNEYKI